GPARISDDWTSGSGKSMRAIAAVWAFVEEAYAIHNAKQTTVASKPEEQKVPERAHWDDATLKDVPKHDIMLSTTYIFTSVPTMTRGIDNGNIHYVGTAGDKSSHAPGHNDTQNRRRKWC